MKIVKRAKQGEDCRKQLLTQFELQGDTSKALYGHYGDRFIHEMHSTFDGKQWITTFEVGKKRKED